MTLADTGQARPNGRTSDFTAALSKVPWPTKKRFEQMARSPRMALPTPSKTMHLSTDRVRAKPAISPTLSMNIGLTAVGLGVWGLMFPRSVARTLGVDAPAPVIQAIFGLREMWTGLTLASDPTKAGMLWTRVAGDAFDIAVLKALDNPKNRQRGAAKAALGFVLAVTALDVITAIRMTNVKRNCA